jgi:hypothetical protein
VRWTHPTLDLQCFHLYRADVEKDVLDKMPTFVFGSDDEEEVTLCVKPILPPSMRGLDCLDVVRPLRLHLRKISCSFDFFLSDAYFVGLLLVLPLGPPPGDGCFFGAPP